nr:autotransporter domain-containing protein [Ancylobacter koreensis]
MAGQYSTGSITITEGASFEASYSFGSGGLKDAEGTVNVSGDGTSWAVGTGGTVFGAAGKGTFNLSDGATATDNATTLGYQSGATGTANIEGANTQWTVGGASGIFNVGDYGHGELNVTKGAVVSVKNVAFVGNNANASGEIVISGEGSLFETAKQIDIGQTLTATGSVLISNEGAFEASDVVQVGNGGTGTMTIESGGSFSGTELRLGQTGTGKGTLLIDGEGSAATASSMVWIGFLGTGEATLSDGGTLEVTGPAGLMVSVAGGAGTLNIGAADGDAADAAGIVDAPGVQLGGKGTIVFNHTTEDYAFASSITSQNAGDGTLKVLAGETEISAANTRFSGRVDIASGTLLLGDDDALGTASVHATGGTLAFADTIASDNAISVDKGAFTLAVAGGAATQSGAISGAAGISMEKTGAGVLNLTGDSSAFAGSTKVSAGTLVVGVGGSGMLGGSLEIASGATLAGTGLVEATKILAGGSHGPGNSVGSQTVAGDYFNAGTLVIEGGPDGFDRIVVKNGTVTLADATLSLDIAGGISGSLLLGSPYLIIENDGVDAVNGSFAPLPADTLLFIDTTVEYDAGTGNDVALSFARNDVGFADVAFTRNQRATASALDTLSPANPVWNALVLLGDGAAARGAYDALSGAEHATVEGLFVDASRFPRQAVLDRLRAAGGGVGASAQPVVSYAASPTAAEATPAGRALKAALLPATTERGVALWSTGYGSWADAGSTAEAAGYSADTGGALIGADTLVGQGWRLGVFGGYGYTSFDFDGEGGSGSADSWSLGAYAGNSWGPLALRTGLAYGWNDVESQRAVLFPGIAQQLKADYDAGLFQAFGEIGYAIQTPWAAFEPFAALAYVRLNRDGFTEQGGSAALDVASADMDTSFTTLGIRMEKDITLGTAAARLRGALGWQHAFGDITPEATQSFASGSVPFTVTGVPIAEDAALVEAGLDVMLTDAVTLGASYSGQFGDATTQNGFNATLKVQF